MDPKETNRWSSFCFLWTSECPKCCVTFHGCLVLPREWADFRAIAGRTRQGHRWKIRKISFPDADKIVSYIYTIDVFLAECTAHSVWDSVTFNSHLLVLLISSLRWIVNRHTHRSWSAVRLSSPITDGRSELKKQLGTSLGLGCRLGGTSAGSALHGCLCSHTPPSSHRTWNCRGNMWDK